MKTHLTLFGLGAALSVCLPCAATADAFNGPLEQAAVESRATFHETGVADGSAVVAASPASGAALQQLSAAGKLAGAGDIAPVAPPKPSAYKTYASNDPFVRNENDGFWVKGGKSLLALVAWPLFLGPVIGAAIGYKLGGPFIGVPLAVVGAAAGVVAGCLMALIGFFGSGIPR